MPHDAVIFNSFYVTTSSMESWLYGLLIKLLSDCNKDLMTHQPLNLTLLQYQIWVSKQMITDTTIFSSSFTHLHG